MYIRNHNDFIEKYRYGKTNGYDWDHWEWLEYVFRHMSREEQKAVISACGEKAGAGIPASITFPCPRMPKEYTGHDKILTYYVTTYYENGKIDDYHYGWKGHIIE